MATERIRHAAKNLEQSARRIQSEMNSNMVLFKMVAEAVEKENNSQGVSKLRESLLELVGSAHRLEHQSSALLDVSANFEAREEETDFGKRLDEYVNRLAEAEPFEPASHPFYDQFNRSVWNINHAGEALPGEEQEFVMITSQYGILNQTCPLTGKRVVDLEHPVRSTLCHHVYEEKAALEFIARAGRRACSCAIPGCPQKLTRETFVCDAALTMEIEELRQRDRLTQVATYTSVDLEDDV